MSFRMPPRVVALLERIRRRRGDRFTSHLVVEAVVSWGRADLTPEDLADPAVLRALGRIEPTPSNESPRGVVE